jgi:hypothetical protein
MLLVVWREDRVYGAGAKEGMRNERSAGVDLHCLDLYIRPHNASR